MKEHLRQVCLTRPPVPLLLPVLLAVALTAVCTSALDGGDSLQVLRGVALLLAVAVATAVDEPLARLLEASPTPWATRVGARVLPAVGLAGAAWWVSLLWAERQGDPPALALTYELVALAAVGTALSAGLRRWSGTAEPAVLTGPLLGGLLLASSMLPRRFGLLEGQTWGPPWEAAHLRWSAVLLAAVGALVLGLSDPSTAYRRRRRPRGAVQPGLGRAPSRATEARSGF